MKQKFQMRPRTILFTSSLMFFIFFFSFDVWAQEKNKTSITTDKQEMDNQPSPTSSAGTPVDTDQTSLSKETQQDPVGTSTKTTLSVNRVLTRFAQRATDQLRPDVRNGLIRIAILTTQGEKEDEPTRQALAAVLARKIAQQPNTLILEPTREKEVMERFAKTGLPMSDNRSISLGQHLGVRYLVITEIEAGPDAQTLKLKTKTVSVKRRGPLKSSEDEALVSVKDMMAFKQKHIFYEKKLEATWRSALIPGWGQLYQGKRGAAVAYMTLGASLLIGGIWATQAGNDAAERYKENTSNTIYYRQLANNHYARAQLLWGALGATWFASTLSAYLQGEDRPHLMVNFDPNQGHLGFSGVF